ncbi:MAG: flagellar assembly protein FliW [Sulfurospirillaceae bacterium]|nr:flagellar assembly protein FliW [Sulfurospirillaceae bacterium]MDD2826043.1 flagellar assembly protein FliW [Sulfurospirillaceae bacterium]
MVFTVKAPIPGFEIIKEIEVEKIDDFFVRIISKSDKTTFTTINPFMIRNYIFDIPEYFQLLLGINEKTNILILNIMIIATPIESSTINFIAPIIFNTDNGTVAQVLLDAGKYPDFGLMESISNYLNKEEV